MTNDSLQPNKDKKPAENMGEVFMILGFVFLILGFSTNWIFAASGITFLALGFYYFTEEKKAKANTERADEKPDSDEKV